LHACCHSQATVEAGLAIIEEMKQRRCGFEQKTLRGPGAGNEGWTALHMAAAYGIAPLVVCLIAAGANANTLNSLTWSPLNEACHRGFVVIARELVSVGHADVKHLPDVDAHRRAPFARPPPQSPLGEAARCGFYDICKLLLESGALTEQTNYVGWTPLHEAAFYNHLKTVKVLLSFGADASAPNGQGVYPYQLASSDEVKAIIKEIAGDSAVDHKVLTAEAAAVVKEVAAPKSSTKSPPPKQAPSSTPQSKASPNLHSGAMLGDLPALSPALDKSCNKTEKPSVSTQKNKNSSKKADVIPEGFPKHLLCAICERPLQDPVRSPYGGVFERKAIHTWIDRNGSVCPLTGQPLVKTELQNAPDIKAEVANFFEKPKASSDGGAEEDLYDF
jgi:ankyrin repeat protein